MPLPARRTMELPRRLPALPAGLLPRAVLGAAALLIAPVIWIALEETAPSGPAGPASPYVSLAVTKNGTRGGEPPRAGDDPHASDLAARVGEHDRTSPGEVIARAAILGDADLAARWATLDLARSLIAAARAREPSSALTPVPPEARDRLLFRIGVGALLLDDRAELAQVLDRLSRREATSPATVYRDLLAGGRARLDGSAGSAERIAELLERDSAREQASRRLFPAESEQFRRLAERGRLAAAVDRPAMRFEGAKTWAELGESARPWFDRSLELLRSECTLRRDLAYPLFLEARIALEEGCIAGVSERLRGLLDERSPPGLSRMEIAALLVVVEEHGDDIAAAGELRAAARETLDPLADEAVDDLGPAECARTLRLILDLEAAPAGWLGEEEPAARLDELEARFARAGVLPFELEEARRLLCESLIDSARRQSRSGEHELARATLERVLRLGGGSIEPAVAAGE